MILSSFSVAICGNGGLSPNELYQAEFLAGLKESDEDIHTGNMKEVCSFGDFIS